MLSIIQNLFYKNMILFNKTYLALNVLQASQDTPIDRDDSEKFPEVYDAWTVSEHRWGDDTLQRSLLRKAVYTMQTYQKRDEGIFSQWFLFLLFPKIYFIIVEIIYLNARKQSIKEKHIQNKRQEHAVQYQTKRTKFHLKYMYSVPCLS